jgi:CheY-like chemotaxis protein
VERSKSEGASASGGGAGAATPASSSDDEETLTARPSTRARATSSGEGAVVREPNGAAGQMSTPRVQQPRQLLAGKFPAGGTKKPGIGLPGAGGSSSGGISPERLSPSSASSPLSSANSSPASTARQSSGPDLLLVEDVRVSQRIAQQALTRANFKVEVAATFDDALAKYRQHSPTLRVILMDINLGENEERTGIDATERIRAYENSLVLSEPSHPRALIFGLTGNVDEENMKQYQACGMNGCIAKGMRLVKSVQMAMEQAEKAPDQFVNLATGDSE